MKTVDSLPRHLSSLCPCASLSPPFHPHKRTDVLTGTLLAPSIWDSLCSASPLLLSLEIPALPDHMSSFLEKHFLNTINLLSAPIFFFFFFLVS